MTRAAAGAPETRAVSSIIYLSGAPRLSTSAETESLGPRSHILGVLAAFTETGADVSPFIVGDQVPQSFHGAGSEARMTGSLLRRFAADVGRVAYRVRSRVLLRRRLKSSASAPELSYERYALMQELGSVTKRYGATWVLEVNALLAVESTTDRRATSSRRLATFFERRTLRRADLIVAVTDQLANLIHQSYGVPTDRIIVIENGVDASKHGTIDKTPQAVPTIGFLGTLYPWQRVDDLLHAVVASNTPWRIRIAGDGPELSALQSLTHELGLDDRVEFLGRVHPDDVPAFLQSVDICYAGHGSSRGVYFSPLKLWEYLAAGKPVLASAHETTERLHDEGYAVELFTDAASLNDALKRALVGLQTLTAVAADRQPLVRASHSWTARIAPLLVRVGDLRRAA